MDSPFGHLVWPEVKPPNHDPSISVSNANTRPFFSMAAIAKTPLRKRVVACSQTGTVMIELEPLARRWQSIIQRPFVARMLLGPPRIRDDMIKNFRDHAANERTFLAWIKDCHHHHWRLAFSSSGSILFLQTVAPSLSGRVLSPLGHRFGNIAGLALIVAGTAMVALAISGSSTTPNLSIKMRRPLAPAPS